MKIKILRNVSWLLCFFLILGVGVLSEGRAIDSIPKEQHSKDYKAFLPGSPEAVVTAFVEADLGDKFNREDENRYHLWWDLTKQKGAPEDCQKLIIKSYKIAGNKTDPKTGDVIVNLEMDVRAIQLLHTNRKNETTDYCKWRGNVKVLGKSYRLDNKRTFIEQIWGKSIRSDDNNKIANDTIGYYQVPINCRKWIFEVSLVKNNRKWLIASDTIPIQSRYIDDSLKDYEEQMNKLDAMNEVCDGKRAIDKFIMTQYEVYDDKLIGNDLNKYKAKYCNEKKLSKRKKQLEEYISIVQILKIAKED